MNSILDLKLINLMPRYLRNNKDVIALCEAWDFQKNEIIVRSEESLEDFQEPLEKFAKALNTKCYIKCV